MTYDCLQGAGGGLLVRGKLSLTWKSAYMSSMKWNCFLQNFVAILSSILDWVALVNTCWFSLAFLREDFLHLRLYFPVRGRIHIPRPAQSRYMNLLMTDLTVFLFPVL